MKPIKKPCKDCPYLKTNIDDNFYTLGLNYDNILDFLMVIHCTLVIKQDFQLIIQNLKQDAKEVSYFNKKSKDQKMIL